MKRQRLTKEQEALIMALVSFAEQNWYAFLTIAEEYQISEDDAEQVLEELNA